MSFNQGFTEEATSRMEGRGEMQKIGLGLIPQEAAEISQRDISAAKVPPEKHGVSQPQPG